MAQKHKFGEKKFSKNKFFGKKSKILGLLGFCWDSAGIYVPAAGILQVSQQNPSISIPARTGPLSGFKRPKNPRETLKIAKLPPHAWYFSTLTLLGPTRGSNSMCSLCDRHGRSFRSNGVVLGKVFVRCFYLGLVLWRQM